MVDTTGINSAIARAQRRLRLQSALELSTFGVIYASAVIAGAVYAVRTDAITAETGWLLSAVGLAGIAVAAIIGWARRVPTAVAATRIDRASDLHDRLASATEFVERLKTEDDLDPEVADLMELAIEDAVRALPKADVKLATPFRPPRDTYPALAFAGIAALLAGLYYPAPATSAQIPGPSIHDTGEPAGPENPVALDEDDIEYTEELLDELRRRANETKDPHLQKFVNDVDALLKKAKSGELSKEQLLDKLAELENKYMEGSSQDADKSKKELAKTGKELQKSPETKALGKALEKGDLEKAQKELEKLAKQLENNKLSPKKQEKIAKAMKKATEAFEKREQKKEKREQEQIDRMKKQVEKLKRRKEKEQNPQKKEQLARRQEQKQRELKKLERKRNERKKSEQSRAVKELHRNMKKASEQMRKQRNQSQEQKQQQQKLAARSLRRAAKDTGKVDREQRKVTNQKKVASQLSDLREAMRRARKRGRSGPRDLFGKNRRNGDFRKRARGKRGSRKAWRRGQGQKPGQGKGKGKGQGQGQGQQPGGEQYGDGHDPDLMGDPTAKSGNTSDEDLQGVQGKGASTRETILTAATKGFSSRSYRNVYAKYKTIVEEVMRTEKVPSGYKYYVKRYFLKIKPN